MQSSLGAAGIREQQGTLRGTQPQVFGWAAQRETWMLPSLHQKYKSCLAERSAQAEKVFQPWLELRVRVTVAAVCPVQPTGPGLPDSVG